MIEEKVIESYPGIGSFQDTPQDRVLFRGRTREAELLFDMVLSDTLAVLYSRSGLGKTSLINAGLLHKMRSRNYFTVVARLINPIDKPVASILGYIRKQAELANVTISGVEEAASLWIFLYKARFNRGDKPVKLFLVLDQFEELFTRVREHDRDHDTKAEVSLIRDLSDVIRRRLPDDLRQRAESELERIDAATLKRVELEGRDADEVDLTKDSVDPKGRRELVELLYETSFPDMKVLISLREDHLADLDRMRTWVPAIFRNMLRLEALTVDAATKAIVEPAKAQLPGKDTFEYDDDSLKRIVEFLRKHPVERERRWVVEDTIDPWQLQILCRSLDRKRRAKKKDRDRITLADMGDEKALHGILTGFYLDTLKRLPALRPGPDGRRFRPGVGNLIAFHAPRASARVLVEKGLITRSGSRNSIPIAVVCSDYGITDHDLQRLKDEKLVRSTTRDDVEYIEITHDSLIRPIHEHAKWRFRRGLVIVAVIYCTISFLAITILSSRKNFTIEEARQELHDVQTREQEITDEKSDAFMKELEMQRDFSRRDLRKIVVKPEAWKGVFRVNFGWANLSEAHIEGAFLFDCDFRHADLNKTALATASIFKSDFGNADMTEADAAGVHFYGTKLERLIAPGAIFNNATFGACDLTNANLRGAKFRNVSMEQAVMTDAQVDNTDFDGTAWWLASGWSDTQRAVLKAKFPPKKLIESARFLTDIAELKIAINTATAAKNPPTRELTVTPEKASALNELAWYYAVRGVELDEALKLARQARALNPAPYIIDTLGFILLMKEQPQEARKELDEAVALAPEEGEIVYHLSLAYRALRDTTNETLYRRRSRKFKYTPSYEYVVMPRPAALVVVTPSLPVPVPPAPVALPPITTPAEQNARIMTLIGQLENGPNPWGHAEGNFDGSGITFGVIGFTVESGELQKILKTMRELDTQKFDAIVADGRDDMNRLLEAGSIKSSMDVATSTAFQTQGASVPKLKTEWVTRFAALGAEPRFREVQMELVEVAYLTPARAAMKAFEVTSRRALTLMADIAVQNGRVQPAAAVAIRAAYDEARNNNVTLTESQKITIIAKAVSEHSPPQWRDYIRLRKLGIANGRIELEGVTIDLNLRDLTLERAF